METIIFSILSIYGIGVVITETSGPYKLFNRLRKNKHLSALNCFICTSVYLSIFCALWVAQNALELIIFSFVFLGGSILLYRLGK